MYVFKIFDFGKKFIKFVPRIFSYSRNKSNFIDNFIKQNSFKILFIYKKNLKSKAFYYQLTKLLFNFKFDSNSLIQEKKSNSRSYFKTDTSRSRIVFKLYVNFRALFFVPR